MKKFHKIYGAAIVIAAMSLSSCDEFTPVFTGQYENPDWYETVEMEPTHTIAQLVATYKTGGQKILDEIVIAGQVSSSDQSGNFYRSFYIQDGTGGIEIKMGKTGLYNEYKLGQTVYVDCQGLWLGTYGYNERYGSGMVQIGFNDPTGEYETSYFENQYLIDQHVFRGAFADALNGVVPLEPSDSDLPGTFDTQATNRYVGALVTLKDLTYANEIFTLMYVSSNLSNDLSRNRVFLSEGTFNVTTWAMTEQKVIEHLQAGDWDSVSLGNSGDYNYGTVGDAQNKATMLSNASPANVSQYFTTSGGKSIQIRTSGYSRFADTEIDPEVLAGNKTINATGILTMYRGELQLVLLDITGITVND